VENLLRVIRVAEKTKTKTVTRGESDAEKEGRKRWKQGFLMSALFNNGRVQ
jgi:hypothetical protein